MEKRSVDVVRRWRFYLPSWIFCLAVLCQYAFSLNMEGQLLLKWKQGLEDVNDFLDDWSPNDTTPCLWAGVYCDQNSISAINFTGFNSLAGPLRPDTFGRLPNLRVLNVGNTNIYGDFPRDIVNCSKLVSLNLSWTYIGGNVPADIGNLISLQHLDLSYAYFNGAIVDTIGNLRELRTLGLQSNYLEGCVPESISSLKELEVLTLGINMWTGEFPSSIFTLPNLKVYWMGDDKLEMMPMPDLTYWVNMEELRLYNVNLSQALFPTAVERMTKLVVLQLSACNMTGPIPEFLHDLTHLEVINLDRNSFTGDLPDVFRSMTNLRDLSVQCNQFTGRLLSTIWQCKKLEILFLHTNHFHGDIAGIGNLSRLRVVDISDNNFTGLIPSSLGNLTRLTQLNLSFNNLTGEIPPSIAEWEEVYEIRLNDNQITGTIPYNLGTMTVLRFVDFGTNNLEGVIPPNLCRSNELTYLSLKSNKLTGGIPATYGTCSMLDVVMFSENQLEGPVPGGLWGGTRMSKMMLNDNNLNGTIAASIGLGTNLSLLFIENNRFEGPIPPEIGKTVLSKLRAHSNDLDGALPDELNNLINLTELSLGKNRLSGTIPPIISNCRQIVQLDLSGNDLEGAIPAELADLTNLSNLDLSENNLTGHIPVIFFNLVQLQSLNIAFNNLSGVIPKLDKSLTYVDVNFTGNPYLCIEGSCYYGMNSSYQSPAQIKKKTWSMIAGNVAAILLLMCVALWFCLRKCKKSGADDAWILTSFQRQTYHDYEITDLDEVNLIGAGGSGKVYRATLTNGDLVAVKKLWGVKKNDRNNDHSFMTEVRTLANIRHRHIVKLLCCCSNRDKNLLVCEYMPNGSLGDLLHSTKAATLSWELRYRIALGAAMGLQHLHHDCVPLILHRDIKSNNILLDLDYEAHLADFGTAKVVETPASRELSTVAGSLGYIAPEYAFSTRVGEKSDIYSFGVVLLELVTGKRAVDPIAFGDAIDLVQWVNNKVHTVQGLNEILDPNCSESSHKDMIAFLRVARLCTSVLPVKRPSMR